MQTIVRTYDVYKFSELSEDAQDHAIEKLWNINVDFDDWHECELDYWQTEKLPELGYKEAKIYYSGFSSQGDGASFQAKVDVIKWIKAHKESKRYASILAIMRRGWWVDARVWQEGYYYHKYTMQACVDSDYQTDNVERDNRISALLSELQEDILDQSRDTADEIYHSLEKEYDYLTSRESIIETIECNDYDFRIDGELFH